MSARDQIESLLAIIKEAAFSALDEYENTGHATPTLDSLTRHPLDTAENELELKKIIRRLEGACEQLCTTLAPPTHTIMNRAQDFGWACLQVAVQHKFADGLMNHPGGLHVDVLSAKVKVHPMKLASILRVLAAKHCFREVAPDIFANNRLSLTLVSDHPMSALVDFVTMEGQKSALALSGYLHDPQFGQSLSVSKAALQYSQGLDGITFYEWLELTEQQIRRETMIKAMVGMSKVVGSLSTLHVYPWNQMRTVCDVGSGMGGFARSLLERSPNVHVTQFDLPNTIALAKQHWNDDFAERVTFVEGDFFNEIPVKNCDVYYIQNVLHNWTDNEALTILQSVRASMGSHSRVLVQEQVLRHMSPTSGSDIGWLDKAPEPLLPNYGAGQIRVYHLDLTMVMMFNTRERTVVEMTKIAEQANLHLLKVFDLAGMCLLEFCIAD